MVKESPIGGVPVAGGAPAGRPHPVAPLDMQRAKLAHDINNPLAIIAANLEYALAELEAGRSATARIRGGDDELASGAALRRCLRDHEGVVTAGGSEVLALLAKGEVFDVILCDLTMQGMGGDELYGHVVDVAPAHAERMVFITGGATTPRAQAFIDAVRSPVLRKPFDIGELREVIRSRLAARQ